MSDFDPPLRLPAVAKMFGVSHITVRRWVAKGVLPRPTVYGPRTFGWPANVIAAWKQAREAEAAAGGAR